MFTINSSIPSKILETPEDDKVLTVARSYLLTTL